MVVQVGDGHLWIALPQGGDELRCRQRSATEGVEIGLGSVDRRRQHLTPQPGQPAERALPQVGATVVVLGAAHRPRQRVTVHLARCARGQFVDDDQARDKCCGQRLRQLSARVMHVEAAFKSRGHGDVAHQKWCAACRFAHRGRSAADAGQVHQRGVDLAELDTAATDLHLVVGAPHEVEAVHLQPHQIAAAVGAAPQRQWARIRERGVLFRILFRVEVARQAYPADDELTDLAHGDRLALLVHDSEIPTGQRQADADRAFAIEPRRARDDRRLGGAVGIPDLAACGVGARREPLGKLGRAGLAAEDQQPHRFQGLGGPQRRQRRHRRDHRDVARHQPRAEVHTAAHQRPRRRDEARTVPPRQPHLLTRRVECHRQPGQHPVARAQRVVLQEHLRLGVDERGRVAVGDGDSLRGSRRPGGEDDPRVVSAQR